jgi:hypothetical protein
VIRTVSARASDWLDDCCWGCGAEHVAAATDGWRVCADCRSELLSEPQVDPLHVARLAYWESHALRCCWRCMTRWVDPDDEVGMCASCREQLADAVRGGAA